MERYTTFTARIQHHWHQALRGGLGILASDLGWQGNQVSGPVFEIKSVALVDYFQVVTACNLLNFERGTGNMNPHAFQICVALLCWRRLAEILIINKHINCSHTCEGIFCQ